MLDRWEEPVNKSGKISETSIRDVLQFRRALDLMDECRPFGEAFGPASTRDDCIMSAHLVYFNLMKLTPGEKILAYDTMTMLADGDLDKNEQRGKKSALLRLFRPDRQKQVPLLAFVQACDSVYRRLRYFRASVGNATVIDLALESVIDWLFGSLWFLIVLTILEFNP